MKKKRIGLILMINVLAIVVMAVVMVATAAAADSPASMGTESAASEALATGEPITVTLLNVSTFPPYDAFHNGIPVYYDHNEGAQVPFYGGGWIGVNICNNEDVSQSVDVELGVISETVTVPFPSYTSAYSDQNYFMLGKNQNYSITVPDIPAGECQISYHYIYTPRFKNDPANTCAVWADSHNRGACGSQEFYVDVIPTIGISKTVSGTLVMDEVITANPGEIEQVVESSDIFTLTVFFESGNLCTASGSCSGSYMPTTYYDHDAGVMHLIRIGAVATDTDGIQHVITNVMRIEGAAEFTLNQDPLRFVYVFDRDKGTNIIFNPSYAASSGSTNYKGNADEVGVPTAITLQSVSAGDRDDTLILALAGAGILVLVSAMIIWRRRQQVKPT